MSGEEWTPVFGFEADYEVSRDGDVRRSTPGRGARAGHVLKPHITVAGYRQVALRRDGRTFSKLVCQLVCETFHGARPDGQEVRHLDGNSQNDSAANLAWGTHYENVQDMRRHGTHRNSVKTECVRGHAFTEDNTARRPNGGRRCMTCKREQQNQRRRLASALRREQKGRAA